MQWKQKEIGRNGQHEKVIWGNGYEILIPKRREREFVYC